MEATVETAVTEACTEASDVLCQPKNSSDPTQAPSSHPVHRRRYIWPPGKHSRSLLLSLWPENAAYLSRRLNLTLPSPQQMAQPACYKVSLLEVSPSPFKTKHEHTLSESNLAAPGRGTSASAADSGGLRLDST